MAGPGNENRIKAIVDEHLRNTDIFKLLSTDKTGTSEVGGFQKEDRIDFKGTWTKVRWDGEYDVHKWTFNIGAKGWDGYSTFVGIRAGENEGIGEFRTNPWNADYNTGFGYEALRDLTEGNGNNAFGYQAGLRLTTGWGNVFLGDTNGQYITTATENTFVGNQVNYLPASEASAVTQSIGLGRQALSVAETGTRAIIIGHQAADTTVGLGTNNIAIGYQAFRGATNVGTDNFMAGYRVNVGDNASASYNVVIGATAKSFFDECVVLGRGAASTADNQFVIGSATYNVGATAVEAVTPDTSWTVRINGVNYKIPMEAI